MFANKIHSYILLSILVSFTVTGNAQVGFPPQATYHMEHFGEEEGLLQNSITCVLPDKNGYLWVGTEAGITRFNGRSFLPLSLKTDEIKNSLTRIKSIVNKGNDTILVFSDNSRKIAYLVNGKIACLEEQRVERQGLLFSNQHYSIPAPPYINGSNFSSTSTGMAGWSYSEIGYIGSIYNKDTFMVVLEDGIGIYDSKKMLRKIKINNNIAPKRIMLSKQQIIYVDNDNYANFYTIAGNVKKRIRFPIPLSSTARLFNNSYGKNFYLATGHSLYSIDVNTTGQFEIKTLLTDLNDEADISLVFEKDSNTIVLGTFTNGLYVYRKKKFSTTLPLPHKESDAFYGQLLLPDNQTILTGKDKLFINNTYIGKLTKNITENRYAALIDKDGNYWYDIKKHLLYAPSMNAPPETLMLFRGPITILFEDNQNRIWLKTAREEFGYFKNKKFTSVKISNIPTWAIACMRQDNAGKYYIGTYQGLYFWNIDESAGEKVTALKSFNIRYIWPDQNGITWVCTYGNGIFLIIKKGVTSFLGKNNKLAYAHTIVEDKKGYFWIPTNNGLFVTTRRSLLKYSQNKLAPPFFYEFTIKNGLRTNEFNGGGEAPFIKLPNGNISLATMKGLVQFDPEKIVFDTSSSPIMLDDIYLDSTEIAASDNFNVGNDIKNICFSIFSSFWCSKENAVWEYQLIGQDHTTRPDQWLTVDQTGKINFFNPSYGSYQLVIRKRKGLEADDYLYKTISFTVLPQWYQTRAFIFADIFGAIGVMIAIFFWRRRYYRRSTRILKGKINAATLELRQMNNTLEKKVIERTLAIQQAEIKFRTLVEESLVGVYILQGKRFVYVNPRFEEILGYDKGELAGTKAVAVINEEQHDLAVEKIMSRINGKTNKEQYEIGGIKKDGTHCQLEFFGSSTIYEGKPTIIGTMVDITERNKMEKELKEAEMKFKDLVEKSLVGVYIIKDRKIYYANPRLAEIIGYTLEELTGAPTFDFIVHKDDMAFVANNIEQMRTAQEMHYETRCIKKDSTLIYIEVFGRLTVYEGEPAIIGSVIDITEKKYLEQEIQKQKAEEQKMMIRAILTGEERERNKIGQELHDNVNQILAGTKLYLSTAKKNVANGENIINESIALIDSAIDEIRSLSTGKVTPVKKVDLEELLRSLVNTLNTASDIITTLTYKRAGQMIHDELKLNIYRILQELLNNILKHAGAKNVIITVEAGIKDIVISVKDDGKGFDPEIKKKGIGISNITNRVESFNGTIKILSSYGNGSKIDIYLPLGDS